MTKNERMQVDPFPESANIEARLLAMLSDCERALAEALMDLSHFYQSVGNPKKASAYLEYVMPPTMDLEQRARHYLQKGQLMEQQNNYRMAMAFYAQALPLEPTDSRVWYLINNNLGYCLNHFQEYIRAEEYCRSAIRVDPSRHNAYKNLGISLEGQGHFLDAIASYIQAIEMRPQDPRALLCLEEVLKRQPFLLIENPDLSEIVAKCQEAVLAAKKQE